ncbi:MAG: maleylpyruvate isomerase family mycothiol-dependent enzyme [Mycobacteriales bacterium]
MAQRDLAADVPTCPDWTVRDALVHTGHVYLNKVANMRTMAKAEFAAVPAPAGGEIEWFRAAFDELVGELVTRGPDAAAYTWFPPDQTVGFWYRRMAQETAVHRVDVESAFGQVTPIAEDLAVDGIDEMLDLFVGGEWDPDSPDWGDVSHDAGAGTTTAVSAGDRAWWITLQPDRIGVTGEERPADARVTGSPSEVLLWLWGRLGDDALTVDGDAAVLRALRDRLTIAGQ